MPILVWALGTYPYWFAITAIPILVGALGNCSYWKWTPSRQCQYWYGHLTSAQTGDERHCGNANTGKGTWQVPNTGIEPCPYWYWHYFPRQWDDGTGLTPTRQGRSTSSLTNNNQKALEWWRSFGVGRWRWHGGAVAEEDGAVRTRRFVDVATSRGR